MNDTSDTSDFLGNTKPKRPIRGRAWCLTINNYTDNDIKLVKDTFSRYIIGKEVAPTTNTRHLQIYGTFINARTFLSLKKVFPTAHIAKAKGSDRQNFVYCSKDDDYETNFTNKLEDYKTFQENLRLIYDIDLDMNAEDEWLAYAVERDLLP